MSDGYGFYGFVSYKRDPATDPWHAEVKRQLETYIRFEIGMSRYALFLDTKGIRSGQYWADTLQSALARSPILIAFCSQAYFRRNWCMAELQTFMAREDHLGLPRGSLIRLVAVRDPSNFPGWAKALQFEDYSEHFVFLPSYWRTEKAALFLQEKLEPLAREAAAMIRARPDFRLDFPRLNPPAEDLEDEEDDPLMPFGNVA